jgi:uncharacterized protein YnzC (UPF0291/DUF896 family)
MNIEIKQTKELKSQIRISNEFRNNYLNYRDNKELLNQPLIFVKVLCRIFNDLKDYQIIKNYKNQQTQLDFWNKNIRNQDYSLDIKLTYNVSMFSKNRNKEIIEAVLEYMRIYDCGKYTYKDKTETKKASGGLISKWIMGLNSGNFEIYIPAYWIDKIMLLEDANAYNIETIGKLNNIKQFFFYTLITSRLVKNKFDPSKTEGKYSLETLNSLFDLKYKNGNDLLRNFILPLKLKFDSQPYGRSFNVTFNKDKTMFWFTGYEVKPDELKSVDFILTEKELKEHSLKYRLSYLARYNSLNKKNIDQLKLICGNNVDKLQLYYTILKQNKIKLKGDDFVSKIVEIAHLYSVKEK